MASLMNEGAVSPLERSCGAAAADWIRIASSCRGFERIEPFFSGHAFDPHRHDTYAIGFTTHGVQSFRYRGTAEHSVAGQVFVLHPDETHDGHAGTSAGFRYRILYIEPGAIRDALGKARPLPFVREAVSLLFDTASRTNGRGRASPKASRIAPGSNNRDFAAAVMPALDRKSVV